MSIMVNPDNSHIMGFVGGQLVYDKRVSRPIVDRRKDKISTHLNEALKEGNKGIEELIFNDWWKCLSFIA